MKATITVLLIALISISVGSAALIATNAYYMETRSQGPYVYVVNLNDGIQVKDLDVIVNVTVVSLPDALYVGDTKIITIGISAENTSNLVKNFSWVLFRFDLSRPMNGRWVLVGFGSYFLDRWESSSLRLYRQMDVPVRAVNLNYFESAEALLRIGILMDVYYNNTEYSMDYYTPREIGPIAIVSALHSPIISGVLCAALAAILAVTISREMEIRSKKTKRRKEGD